MSQSAEKELAEFLAALPALMQRFLQYDWSCLNDPSFSQEEVLEFCKWFQDKEPEVRREYERILMRDRAKWNEYCRSAKKADKFDRQSRISPKGKPGRPQDSKAADYAALHRSKSYGQMAKEELQAEPEGEVKKLLVEKERERIRQLVSRSRRRKNT